MSEQANIYKICLEPDERVWAEKVGKDAYRIDNIPFGVVGYALGDTVRCLRDEDGTLVAVGVLEESGNATILVHFATEKAATECVGELQTLGIADYESAGGVVYSFSVPPTVATNDFLDVIYAHDKGVLDWHFVKMTNQLTASLLR